MALLVLPLWAWVEGGTTAALGRETPDLLGHLWTIWHMTVEEPTRSTMVGWPEGIDLLPILGGWGDVLLGGLAARWLGAVGGWNLAMAVYLALAGVGGFALARALGASTSNGAAVVAGLLLQLDAPTLQHLQSGRGEQVGIGVLALFFAAALHTARTPGWRAPVATALCGLLSVAVAWEYSLFVGMLGLAVFAAAPDADARRRILAAGLGTLLLVSPLLIPFVSRSAALPPGRLDADWALRSARNALVPLGPLGWRGFLPGTAGLLALALVPWTATGVNRRLKHVVIVLLLTVLALSFGPEPHLSAPAEGSPRAWAPFTWLHSVPGLSRYQTPARLLVPWSLLACAAAALLVDKVAHRHLLLGGLVGTVAVSLQLAEVRGLLPQATYSLPDPRGLAELAEDNHPGAIFDLPVRARGTGRVQRQLLQMVHGRPIRHHSLEVYLQSGEPQAPDPVVVWAHPPVNRGAGPPDAMLASLRDRGFGWVMLHQGQDKPHLERALQARLTEFLGPAQHRGHRWRAWRVPTAD